MSIHKYNVHVYHQAIYCLRNAIVTSVPNQPILPSSPSSHIAGTVSETQRLPITDTSVRSGSVDKNDI